MTRLVGSAVGRATTALLDADLALAESVIARRRAGRRAADRPRGALAGAAGPAGAGRHGPADHRHRRCGSAPTWSGWATSPGTWPSSPGCATPSRRSPPSCARRSCRWARSPSGSSRRRAACIASRDLDAGGRARDRRRRHGRPAPRAVHRAARRRVGARHRDGGRRDAVRALLRAVRRPRGLGRAAGRRTWSRASGPTGRASTASASTPRADRTARRSSRSACPARSAPERARPRLGPGRDRHAGRGRLADREGEQLVLAALRQRVRRVRLAAPPAQGPLEQGRRRRSPRRRGGCPGTGWRTASGRRQVKVSRSAPSRSPSRPVWRRTSGASSGRPSSPAQVTDVPTTSPRLPRTTTCRRRSGWNHCPSVKS